MCCNISSEKYHQSLLKQLFSKKYKLDFSNNNKIDQMTDEQAYNLFSNLNFMELFRGNLGVP